MREATDSKQKDEWDKIVYPTLSDVENDTIRFARRKGFASFYPNSDPGDKSTLESANAYLADLEKHHIY